MSAINKLIAVISMGVLIFMQIGCTIKETKPLIKDEPVVVILDENDSNKDTVEETKVLKSAKMPITYNEYNVDLKVNPKEGTFEGIEKIQYTNNTKNPLDIIYLNLYLNAFRENSKVKPYIGDIKDEIYTKSFDEGFIDIKSVLINNEEIIFNQSETILELSLKKAIEIDESIEITMEFKGKVPNISYTIGRDDKSIWMGNFLPTLVVYNKDGWNKYPYYPIGDSFYSDIANYTVNVTTPKDYIVISTGEEETKTQEDVNITTINAKMVRDFALVISNNLKKESIETEEGININLYYDSYTIDSETVLNTSDLALKYYSKKLGSYPYLQLDIIEGDLSFYKSISYPSLILMDSKKLKNSLMNEEIAKAIGHQWFYNIIGNNQIKEAWLDEAMVTYLEENLLFSDKEIKDLMEKDRIDLINNLESMREKSLHTDLSVFSTWESYYNIHYIRGKLMIYALKNKMGEEKFNEFLKIYYEKYAFKIVNTKEFIKTAEEVYGHSLDTFFSQWMDSKDIPKF